MSSEVRVERVLFPAIRWDDRAGFDHLAGEIDLALELGVGGFILFGGEISAVRDLIVELRRRSEVPLLIGADLERGAGQQFRGATSLPPLAALGDLGDLASIHRAGQVTAHEARSLGIDWVFAPVADLDIEPRNPIVGTRSLGSDPELVASQVSAWIEGCHAGGALATVKHFPGHGRTTSDSHITLPRVEVGADALELDLTPFRAALAAGVEGVMTAHVSYPALDPSGVPATLSKPIITGLLRGELGFGGVVLTDALIMEGAMGAGQGGDAALAAIRAGCDILLYPADLEGVAMALRSALGDELSLERVTATIERLDRAIEGVGQGGQGVGEDRGWADQVALRTVRVERGERPGGLGSAPIELITIDDDLGGPYAPPARDEFRAELLARGAEVRGGEARTLVSSDQGVGETVIALYADIRGWKGRPGLSAGAVSELHRILEARPDAITTLFGHPRLAAEIPISGTVVVTAWGGEALMQRAAARWLMGEGG